MNAETLQADAAVRLASPAGDTGSAAQIGLDRAVIAGLQVRFGRVYGDDLDTQLVAEDARVGEERLAAPERMEIRAAHADATHAYDRITRSRIGRRLGGSMAESARFFEDKDPHPTFPAAESSVCLETDW